MSAILPRDDKPRPRSRASTASAAQPEVVITEQLRARQPRAPDYALEARCLRALTADLSLSSPQLLARVARLAGEVTGASSWGVSLIAEDDTKNKRFTLVAIGGKHADLIGGSAPLDHSPCGYAVSRDEPQLFHKPAWLFDYLRGPTPELTELLVVPMKRPDRSALGAIWVAVHEAQTRFDPEHARILTSLASAAGAMLELIQTRVESQAHAAKMALAANDAAAASNAKTDFITALAHEMRNPLMPILTSIQVLDRRTKDPDLQESIAIIRRQAQQLHRLVEDLLDTARVERNELTIRKARTELGRVIGDAVESVAPRLEARKQLLKLVLPEAPVSIRVDHGRVCEALANLIENASKYTPENGNITLEAAVDHGVLTIRVTDTGIGIAADMLQRIFNLYSRVTGASEHGRGGLGIGLWLVRRIVELHGGTVSAQSDGPGKGATFTITLTGVSDGETG